MKWLLFEGRRFDLTRLSRIQRHGRRIIALYFGSPIIIAEYRSVEEAKAGKNYLSRRVMS